MAAPFCLVLALVVALAQPAVTPASVPGSWFGTWKLNLSKSTYQPEPPPYKRAEYTIEPWKDGLKVTYEMVYLRGGWTHLEWSGRLDGKDYPVHGLDELVTYAYRPLADGSHEVIVKFDERITATSTVRLSADGRTMTTTTVGTGARGQEVRTTTVYEKQ
jgi:hypothetical protein